MVSPRKSRSKSLCCSNSVTGTRRRASRRASITPPGPPPTTQHVVCCESRTTSSVLELGAGIKGVVIKCHPHPKRKNMSKHERKGKYRFEACRISNVASIHWDRSPIDISAVVANQPHNERGDRRRLNPFGVICVWHGRPIGRSVDRGRQDYICGNAHIFVFQSHRLDQRNHGRLRGTVSADSRSRFQRRTTPNRNDP